MSGKHHILTVLVENKFGVLSRVAGLFARRGFNIVSLAVSPTEDERFSRMTIVVDAESAPLEQITKQLNKLIPVLKIAELHPDEAVERELMLVTVKATSELRSQITELASIFQARIDDVGHDALTIQVAGAPEKLDAMTDLLQPFGIIELQRTGRIALPKLARRPAKLRAVKHARRLTNCSAAEFGITTTGRMLCQPRSTTTTTPISRCSRAARSPCSGTARRATPTR